MKQNKSFKVRVLKALSLAVVMIPVIITLLCLIFMSPELSNIVHINPTILAIGVGSFLVLIPVGICISGKLIDKAYEIESE